MDYVQLRSVLEALVTGLKEAVTHTTLPTFCEELGLPTPPDDGSKRDRMTASFNALADTELPAVARKLLIRHPPSAQRHDAQPDSGHSLERQRVPAHPEAIPARGRAQTQ